MLQFARLSDHFHCRLRRPASAHGRAARSGGGLRSGRDHDRTCRSFRPGYDITKPISPESYAALRTRSIPESPSLDPTGALATLTSEPTRLRGSGRGGDDNMMVVADVFTNGSASMADVMQAPRDRRMLEDFEKALRQNAAFVPAALDRRPETMRVVFSIQRVDVHDRNY